MTRPFLGARLHRELRRADPHRFRYRVCPDRTSQPRWPATSRPFRSGWLAISAHSPARSPAKPTHPLRPAGAVRGEAAAAAPVIINDQLCIGCKNCMIACPFGSIYINGNTNMLIKCDLCSDITSPGEDPICVKSCPASALTFEPLDKMIEEKRKKAAEEQIAASLESLSKRKKNETK